MKKVLLLILSLMMVAGMNAGNRFVSEPVLKDSLMHMLIRFSEYLCNDYKDIDTCHACFMGENTMGSDERGVRTNADLSMVSAFLCKYGSKVSMLPKNVTWQKLDTMAMKSLCYAIDTHKAVRALPCRDRRYWGSVSKADHQWESSLWAMSVAYSAWMQWNKLDETYKEKLYLLLKSECNYELQRDIPTGYKGDTKAEENGWEADVLAATLGLFPNDSLAECWFRRLREFAVNSYSHPSDASNHRVVDSWFDNATIADLYRGANLYPDWTLQNHDFFHTSYQNVVIQELGEAALALKLFQGDNEKWRTEALLHNCESVVDNVLNWLTLPDGEQAMPNGNDWSLFLYDQITSYSTMACMKRDAAALFFEQQVMKQINHRQHTTADGSWLLRPDVGGRRMGVEAHRVMMSWLMHEMYSTSSIQPMEWNDFAGKYAKAKYFPCQKIVRALNNRYFACMSFSDGKKSYTGYIAPICSDNNNMVVPYRVYNTGNLIGYYEPENGKVNASLVKVDINTKGKDFSVNGTLLENDSSIVRSFKLKTVGDGLEYSDKVKFCRPLKIKKDKTGMLAISTDEFTRISRDVNIKRGKTLIDGILEINTNGGKAVFTDRTTDNSITTTKLYPFGDAIKTSHKIIYKLKW